MAITFPRDKPDVLRFVSIRFWLQPMQELGPLRGGGVISKDLGPKLWRMEVSAPPVDETDLGVIRAWFDTLASTEEFYAFDPIRAFPLAYRAGWGDLTVGGSAFDGTCTLADVASSNKEIDLEDLPSGFEFSPGDYLSFDYSSKRALHRVSAAVTANASGEATIEVRPHVRSGWDADATVTLEKPAARMLIVPDSVTDPVDHRRLGRVSFEAVQTL